jgi:hypothetical protein
MISDRDTLAKCRGGSIAIRYEDRCEQKKGMPHIKEESDRIKRRSAGGAAARVGGCQTHDQSR